MTRKPVVAIVGASSASQPLVTAAEAIGEGLVNAGFRVATGGLGGVMTAASRGARNAAQWVDGDVIGILPSGVAAEANPYVDIAIATGLGFARNVVLVQTADVVVAVGGGSGTLSEIAFAWQFGKPIVALDLGEGWSAKLAGETLDGRRQDAVVRATSPEAVLTAVRGFTQP